MMRESAFIEDRTSPLFPLLSRPPAPLPPPASPQYLTDRVEAVQFPEPGNYLVICTIVFHFMPAPGEFEMFGYVKVVN
jgi:hypothetical protein